MFRSSLACALSLSLALPAIAQTSGPGSNPGNGGQITILPGPATPPRHVPGAATLVALQGVVYDLNSGITYNSYTQCGTGPITNAVAFALRIAQPGDVIVVVGTHPGITFVDIANPCRQNEVGWANGAVVRDVDVVGYGPQAAIEGITVFGDYTQPGGGGVDRVTFQNLRIRNEPAAFAPILTSQSGRNGLIRVYDCEIEPVDPAAWNGRGMKWGIRGYLTSWDVRNTTFTSAEEHNIYIDSPGFDGAYSPSFIFQGNESLDFTGRTGIQIVNRIQPFSGYTGAPGLGTILIRGNTLRADAQYGGGGSVITVAGHHGDVWVENNTVIANSPNCGGSVDEGGLVAWAPFGSWLLPSGHATKALYIQGNTFTGTGCRPNIAASGCKKVWIGTNTFQLNGHGVDFDNNNGGGIFNGQEFLPPSTMSGWQQGGCKARDNLGAGSVCLTDAQIDANY